MPDAKTAPAVAKPSEPGHSSLQSPQAASGSQPSAACSRRPPIHDPSPGRFHDKSAGRHSKNPSSPSQRPLKDALAKVAKATEPFPAFTTGLGVFPGERPVIYIPVLRSDALNALHRRILAATAPLCLRTDKFSGPDCWLPHISLALHDTTPHLLGPVLGYLNQETYNLKIIIDNLTILRQEGDLFVKEEVFHMKEKVLG